MPNLVKGILIGLFFFLVAGCLTGGLTSIPFVNAAKYDTHDWQSVQGRVVNADHFSHAYVWVVNYAFNADGQEYTSEQDTFGEEHHFKSDPHLKAGDAITVYYSPGDPRQSVLDRTLPATDISCLYLPFAFCIIFGIICEWVARKTNFRPLRGA